jgi:hypothetical protein
MSVRVYDLGHARASDKGNTGVLVQIDCQTRLANMAVRRCRLYGAPSTAFQTAGALRSVRHSLSSVNCPLWIRRNSSMPAMVIAGVLNHLNPSIGSMRSFTPRQIDAIARQCNNTPRKCLGFKPS